MFYSYSLRVTAPSLSPFFLCPGGRVRLHVGYDCLYLLFSRFTGVRKYFKFRVITGPPFKRRQRGRVVSGQCVGRAIWWSRVRVQLLPLAGFVFGRPEFKSSDTLITSKLVAPCQLRFLIRFGLFVSSTYLSGVPVN